MSALRLTDLPPEYATRVLHDVPMAKHTSWHVGNTRAPNSGANSTSRCALMPQLPPQSGS